MPKPSRDFPELTERTDMSYRSQGFQPPSVDSETRTVDADISTEEPVLMPDWERMEMVPEVLQTDGVEFPKSRQVPLLDSHNRWRVADQIGSAREIGKRYNSLTAKLHFSEASANEFTKVREGHVTDVSVGYRVLKKVYVPKGETREVNGRTYKGPVNVATKWRLNEVSLTPIGANAQAKLRGLDPDQCRFLSPELKGFQMEKELRDLLVARGMDAGLSDEQAQRWMVDNADKMWPKLEKLEERSAPVKEIKQEERKEQPIDIAAIVSEAMKKADEQKRAERAAFVKEVDANCDIAGFPEEAAKCRAMDNIDEVRAYLKSVRVERDKAIPYGGPSIRQTGSGIDDLTKDMGTALSLRAMQNASPNAKTHDEIFPTEQRGKHADRFRYATPFQMAEEFVRASGVDTRGLTREQVAICAMFGPDKAGVRSHGAALSVTGNFTNLTLDAINKAMMVGYTEAPSTWQGPMRMASSVPDFKNINRIRLGAIPNLPVWNDNSNPEKATFADAKEVYAVEARSLETSFSYRLLVNDDMDALSRVPAQMGSAARRTQNAVAWAQVTSNPTMSDGVALFAAATGARKRTNLTTGAGAPSVSTVQTLTNLMRQMRGENTPDGNEGPDILNLRPAYIVGPSALETTINQLVNSAYDPAATTAIGTMVYNPTRVLTPIIEPLLDASSTTAYYLFANPSQIDTIEITHLQGQETPIVRSWMEERSLSQVFSVLQTFAAKAMNHRGIQKHAGA